MRWRRKLLDEAAAGTRAPGIRCLVSGGRLGHGVLVRNITLERHARLRRAEGTTTELQHLNCGTMHPYGLPGKDGSGGFFKRGDGVLHCLLVETGAGLALVDTGWGVRDCTNPTPAVRQFAGLVGCARDVEETAFRQIEASGLDPADVKHIFLTHLHMDHAGGLPDFPQAIVHASADEITAYLNPRTLVEWRAYRPEHTAHGARWQPHAPHGDHWFGLDCAPPVRLGEAEFVMISLPGHTRGHCAVGVRMGEQWFLHCGDAYGYYRQADPRQPYRYPCGRLMEIMLVRGFNMPRRHWRSIRRLLTSGGDRIQAFCAHDAHEYNGLARGQVSPRMPEGTSG